MKVTVELFKGKTLKDGSNPVMIRITHRGRNRYKSVGVSCKAGNWNTAKREVKKSDPDAGEKNLKIQGLFSAWETKRLELERAGAEPELETLSLDDVVKQPTDKSNLLSVMIEFEEESSYNLSRKLRTVINHLKALGFSKIPLKGFNQSEFSKFQEKVKSAKKSNPTVANHIILRTLQTYHYAVEREYVVKPHNLKAKYIPVESMQAAKEKLGITEYTTILKKIKEDAKFKYARMNFETDPESFALRVFTLMLAFQGMPPIDLAYLKVGDVKQMKVYNIEKDVEQYEQDPEYRRGFDTEVKSLVVYKIRYNRSKTGRAVKIVTRGDLVEHILRTLRARKDDDFLLPGCLTPEIAADEKRSREKVGRYFERLGRYLNKGLKLGKRVTYYDARRMFSTMLYHRGIQDNLIQQMIGHKPSILTKHYIRPFSDYDQAITVGEIFLADKSGYDMLECIRENLDRIYEAITRAVEEDRGWKIGDVPTSSEMITLEKTGELPDR